MLALKFLHFGQAAKRLFGTLHQPQRLQAPRAAVLLCNPFGEEASRAHRIYRVLASQLERRGYPALRFDYHCTGDSLGDATDATVAGWLDDVSTAASELRNATGAKQLIVVGLALGATLAALAARSQRVHHLLLWDPVIDGASYLQELAAGHQRYMRDEMGWAYEDRLTFAADGSPCEAFGVPITSTLAAGLRAIDLTAENIRADHLTIVTTATLSPAHHRLRAALPTARWVETTTSVPWNSDAALNDAVVPMDVLQTLIQRIEEVSP